MKIMLSVLLLISLPVFANISKDSAKTYVTNNIKQVEQSLLKIIGSSAKIDQSTIKCVESPGFGKVKFGVATCLLEFEDNIGGGIAAVNISSDETGDLQGKSLNVQILSTWD